MIYFNALSVINVFISLIFLLLGLYVIKTNAKNKINILFFLKTITVFIFAFSFSFVYSLKDQNLLRTFFKICGIGIFLYFPVSLHFYIELTGYLKKKLFITFFYIPAILLILMNIKSIFFIKEFITEKYFNYRVINYRNIWTYLFISMVVIYLFLGIILLIIKFKKTDIIKIKKQIAIILPAMSIAASVIIIETFILPNVTNYKCIGIAPLGMSFYLIGLSYAVIKYQFLKITPEQISRDILSNIKETIILLDLNNKIISVNKKIEQLVNNIQLKGTDLSKIIFEFDKINENIDKLKNNSFNDFSCRFHLINNKNEMPLMDAKLSIINDKFGDKLGILIIAHEVKELKQLKTFYKITDKEAEIIQHVANGVINKDIAEKIGIAERTVKAHISNIYSKFGVENRSQLLGILKDFNLLP